MSVAPANIARGSGHRWTDTLLAAGMVLGLCFTTQACDTPPHCEVSTKMISVDEADLADTLLARDDAKVPPCDQTMQQIISRQLSEGKQRLSIPDSLHAVQ